MSIAPCKDCINRYPACHSSCDDYKLWETENKERRKKIAKLRDEDRRFRDNHYELSRKLNK